MTFAQVHCDEKLKSALSGMIDSGKIPHAILFHEDDGGQGVPLALAFLQYLYCKTRENGDSCCSCSSCNKLGKLIHPDVHFIFPTASGSLSIQYISEWRELVAGGVFTESAFRSALGLEEKNLMIPVAEASALLQTLSLSALEGGYRSVLVYLPEMMNQEAANKLLKIIEEPPLLTQFLLVTHAPEKVLQTISSRCQRIRVIPESAGRLAGTLRDETFSPLFSDLMDAMLSRNLFASLEVASRISSLPDRESAKAFCKFASECLRQIFLVQQGLVSLAAAADEQTAGWAKGCRKTFPRKGLEALSQCRMLIGRNVNVKIVFSNLVCKLFYQV